MFTDALSTDTQTSRQTDRHSQCDGTNSKFGDTVEVKCVSELFITCIVHQKTFETLFKSRLDYYLVHYRKENLKYLFTPMQFDKEEYSSSPTVPRHIFYGYWHIGPQ